MKIDGIEATPAEDWVEPVIEFQLDVNHEQNEIPLFTGGKVSVDGKSLAELSFEMNAFNSDLMARNSRRDISDTTQRIVTRAHLSETALDYIEEVRRRNPKGGFSLELAIDTVSIRSALRISSLHETEETLEYDGGKREGNLMVFDTDMSIEPGRKGQWFLSAWEATAFTFVGDTIDVSKDITASDWTHDYLDVFSDKKVKTISYRLNFGDMPEELENAWDHLQKAEEKLQNHEDRGVVVECREAFKSVKELEEELKDEIGEEKWNDVARSANEVKDLGLHTVDRGQSGEDGFEEEEITLSDVEMTLNTMRNFVAFASQNYPGQSGGR